MARIAPIASRSRILIIDPYASGRRSICSSLAELGYDVVAAATADDARAITDRAEINVIVADVDDPAICRLISELRMRRSPIPTVRLTTLADQHTGLPPDEPLLEKPMHLDALAKAIDSVLIAVMK